MKRILLALALLFGLLLIIPATSASAGVADQNPQDGNVADGNNPIAKRCSPATNRILSGTLLGQDGMGLNATIGLDIQDSRGRTINLAGCPTNGYSTVLQLNHYIGGHGAKIGTLQRDVKGVAHGTIGKIWAVYHLPANAKVTWVETYPRAYTGSPCGMACAGSTDLSKYGRTNRRAVPISNFIALIAPTTPIYGGSTGAIQATILNSAGRPVNLLACNDTVKKNCISAHAWSVATPEGRIVQGWGTGGRNSTITYKVSALASGQSYTVWIDYANGAGVHKIVRTIVKVNAHATTYFKVKI